MNRTLIADAPKLIGETIKVDGWISSCRDHGKIIFIDLRDRSGSIQAVGSKGMEGVDSLRPEWVVEIVGLVKSRPENMVNEDLETGRIEMEINEIIKEANRTLNPYQKIDSFSIWHEADFPRTSTLKPKKSEIKRIIIEKLKTKEEPLLYTEQEIKGRKFTEDEKADLYNLIGSF